MISEALFLRSAVLTLVGVSFHCWPDAHDWVLKSFTVMYPSQTFTSLLSLLTIVISYVKSLIGVIGIAGVISIIRKVKVFEIVEII